MKIDGNGFQAPGVTETDNSLSVENSHGAPDRGAAGPRLIQVNAKLGFGANMHFGHSTKPDSQMDAWQPVITAPRDRDLEVAVIEEGNVHALIVKCRRMPFGWINAVTGKRIDVRPTHWREWDDNRKDRS